jgi:SM-20-related protein
MFTEDKGVAGVSRSILDLEAIWEAEVSEAPFKYFVAENVVREEWLKALQDDCPRIEQAGSFPIEDLEYGPAFADLIAQLHSRDLTYLIGKKFRINLTQKPLFTAFRGQSRLSDGKIHTDSRSRVISCVLYLNDTWEAEGGRLRMLRSPHSYGRALAEIAPKAGTLVALRRSDRSWHGYLPYEGPRRCVMFNWMSSRRARDWELGRHTFSAHLKRPHSPGDHNRIAI